MKTDQMKAQGLLYAGEGEGHALNGRNQTAFGLQVWGAKGGWRFWPWPLTKVEALEGEAALGDLQHGSARAQCSGPPSELVTRPWRRLSPGCGPAHLSWEPLTWTAQCRNPTCFHVLLFKVPLDRDRRRQTFLRFENGGGFCCSWYSTSPSQVSLGRIWYCDCF